MTGRREKTVEESMIELQQSVVSVLKEVQTTLASLEQTLSAQSLRIQVKHKIFCWNVICKEALQLKFLCNFLNTINMPVKNLKENFGWLIRNQCKVDLQHLFVVSGTEHQRR